MMKYTNGDICHYHQAWSMTVTLLCGRRNRPIDIREPTASGYPCRTFTQAIGGMPR